MQDAGNGTQWTLSYVLIDWRCITYSRNVNFQQDGPGDPQLFSVYFACTFNNKYMSRGNWGIAIL